MTKQQIKDQISQLESCIREAFFNEAFNPGAGDSTDRVSQLEERVDALRKELYRLDEEENISK